MPKSNIFSPSKLSEISFAEEKESNDDYPDLLSRQREREAGMSELSDLDPFPFSDKSKKNRVRPSITTSNLANPPAAAFARTTSFL